ncbi:hypothetical protein BH23BAC2_BH23BAC2_10850 [soil metagenome]
MDSNSSGEKPNPLKPTGENSEKPESLAENQEMREPAAENLEQQESIAKIPKKLKRSKTDPLNMKRPPLKEHSNPVVRGFAKAGYTVWIIVMAVGLFLAFVVSLFLV